VISYLLLVRPAGQPKWFSSPTHIGVRPEDDFTLLQVLNQYPNITTKARANGSECILLGPLEGALAMHQFIFVGETLSWEPKFEEPEPFISIAAHFHDEYEAAAEKAGWATQERSRVAFDELPPENRETMVATVGALFARKLIAPGTNL
jgi:hypothetical protein